MTAPQIPAPCRNCGRRRWVLMGGGVWWCTICDGPVPLTRKQET